MAGDKRATDHLEPAAKKRGSERQLTKDDPSDSEDEPQEAGTFARASEQVLKQRKIIRARRGGPAEPPAAASANPFANVQLASAPPAAANPFAGIALVAPKPAAAQPEQPRTAAEGTKEAPEEAPEAKTEEQKAVEAEAPKPAALGGFGGFGSGASGGGLAFGSSAAGGFGGVAPASSGFGFLAFGANAATGASTGLAFGSSPPAAAAGGDATGTAAAPATSIFGSATATGTPLFGGPSSTKPAAPELPADVPVSTGEEGEKTVFAGQAILFAWNDEKKEWTNRGGGGIKVNVNEKSGQGRMLMRQKDTLRLLLNARLWQGLNLKPMDGGSGITFTCFNYVSSQTGEGGEGTPGAAEGAEGGEKVVPATYAVRVKKADVDAFTEAIKEHMPKGGAVNGAQGAGGEEKVE